jgi:hypothetical protein
MRSEKHQTNISKAAGMSTAVNGFSTKDSYRVLLIVFVVFIVVPFVYLDVED